MWHWDGSDLGERSWDSFVLRWYPALPKTCGSKPTTVLAWVQGPTAPVPVYLKPNFSGTLDQVIVDELKPLFGVEKMGTHLVTIDKVVTKRSKGADWYTETGQLQCDPIPRKAVYFLFRAVVDSNGVFTRGTMLREYKNIQWLTFGEKFLDDIRRIYLFRLCLRVSDTCPSNVLVMTGAGVYRGFSVDEMAIKGKEETCRDVPKGDRTILFPPTLNQSDLLSRMIVEGCPTGEDPNHLPSRVNDVLLRVAPGKDYRWALDQLIEKVNKILVGGSV